MSNKKNTRSMLISAILVLCLCFTALVGTTFAWFTDSVTSGGNVIASGTLDVKLLMFDGTNYVDISESEKPIFGEGGLIDENEEVGNLWEPGKTQIVYLGVKNGGNLALKYNILVDVTDAGLVGALDYAIIDGATKEDADALALASWDDILATEGVQTGPIAAGRTVAAENGALEAEGYDYFALAVHMKDSAGNEYQDKNVVIDITVMATQLSSEEDSFGDGYDANLDIMNSGISRTLDDGSTVFYYDEESGYYGRVRLTDLPEDLGSEYVVPTEVNDLGGALAGVTLDKLTVPAGLQYAYKSLEGATIGEVVIAEGATTVPNRMFYKMNVESVVIPSSVTYLEESAFQQAIIKELVVPASVETFGVHAFAGSTLEKITFEGKNLVFDNRPLRECSSLRTVVFNSESVTFTNTTTNGDCWISNKGANGKNYSNIEFYVKNTDVAKAVRDAIIHEDPATTPIYVDEDVFVIVKNVTEFQTALDNATGDTIISVAADITGDVTFTQVNGISLELNGNDYTMNGSINFDADASISDAATLTIKNFNFKTTDTARSFILSSETNHYPNNLTISGCTFEGTGAGSDVVAVKVKSANNFVIENCKADKVHSLLQNDRGGWNYTVRNCEVTNAGRGINLNSVQGAVIENVKIEASAEKYGIRIDAELNNSVTVTDCEISAFCPVVVRKASAVYGLVFNGENTMTAANTDGYWCVIGTDEYEKNGELPSAATGSVTVTLNDAGLNADGIFGAAN